MFEKYLKDRAVRKRNKALIKKYPFLLPRNVFTDKVVKGYRYEYTLADEMLDGWRIAFGNKIWDELKEILIKDNYLYNFRFTQIKEKYGVLCLYYSSIPYSLSDDIQKWVNKYEKLSETVCAYCGRSADGYSKGWINFICSDCAKRYNKQLVRFGEDKNE